MSGRKTGRNRRKWYGQLRELALDELLAKDLVHARAVEEPAGKAEARELEQALPVEREPPRLQLVEPARRKRGSDERADRASRDEIRPDARLGEGAQHADMRPAARRARAEDESDLGSPPGPELHHIRSKIAAIPCPPPMHIVTRA